jgi:hypothetical protein
MSVLSRMNGAASLAGFSPTQALRNLRGIPEYFTNYRDLRAQWQFSGKEFPFGKPFPCPGDRFGSAGVARGDYFHQDLHVAQLIYANGAEKHVDVASRVDGFVAHVAAFRPIEVIDIRPLRTTARNITFRRLDVMAEGTAINVHCDSLSCLNALEHFGLGRYGDSVDYYGYLRAWRNLVTMLSPRGRFYFSVPIGKQRIEFDAHRVFGLPYLLGEMILPHFRIESFAYVDDDGEMHFDQDPQGVAAEGTFGLRYGCGIFELIKSGSGAF